MKRFLIYPILIFGVLGGSLNRLFAQTVFIDPFVNLSEISHVSQNDLIANCPDIPLIEHLGSFNSEEAFISAYKTWISKSPEQFSFFKLKSEEAGHNIGWSSMKIETAVEPISPDSLRHSFRYFVYEVLDMSVSRVNELAPHFPTYNGLGEYEKDSVKCENRNHNWVDSYPHEYENILNSTENQKLLGDNWEEHNMILIEEESDIAHNHEHGSNEDEGTSEVSSVSEIANLPEFLYDSLAKNRPALLDINDILNLESTTIEDIHLMKKWLWVFNPEGLIDWFGSVPQLPETFNEEKFRSDAAAWLNPNPDGWCFRLYSI